MADKTDGPAVALQEILAELRPAMTSDGCEMSIASSDPGRVVVRLEFTEDACFDCILPADMIRRILLSSLEARGMPSVDVVIDDPRIGAA